MANGKARDLVARGREQRAGPRAVVASPDVPVAVNLGDDLAQASARAGTATSAATASNRLSAITTSGRKVRELVRDRAGRDA